MTVASGQSIYEYEWPTPFRVSSNDEAAISGIHIEAAQFVLNAEMRKFTGATTDNGDNTQLQYQWQVYANEDGLGGSPSGYEPKARGETLDGKVGLKPQITLDDILLTRAIVHDMFFFGHFGTFETFSYYKDYEYYWDWFRQLYPESPSGQLEKTVGVPSDDDEISRFLRPPKLATGSYIPSFAGWNLNDYNVGLETDPDIHWLGGSGVILDIDVGELMWNPYPAVIDANSISDTHGSISRWRIETGPLFPRFQKTDGSLISLNGLEETWWNDDPPDDTIRLNSDHVSLGRMRFTTYPAFLNTEVLVGNLNDLAGDVYHMEGGTQVPVVAAGPDTIAQASPYVDTPTENATLFLDPVVLSSGIYRITSRNLKSDFPYTTVESGIVSQYPNTNTFSRGGVIDSFGIVDGLEVFDEAFWITDWGDVSSGLGGPGPSGLVVVSPFSGNNLWNRRATTAQVSTDKDGAGIYWHKDMLSLQRVGANDIRRLTPTTSETLSDPSTVTSVTCDMVKFNDLLTTDAATSITLDCGSDNGNIVTLYSLVNAGSINWLSGFKSAPANFVWELDANHVEVARWVSGQLHEYMAYISDGKGGAMQTVVYGDPMGDLDIRSFSKGTFPTINYGTTKNIDISSHITGTIQESEILGLVEHSGGSEIQDGVYAYLRIDTTTSSNTLYIARIEEETTTWSIQGLWFLRTVDNDYDLRSEYNHGIIIMDIN